jgi:hypothetical protein
MFKAKIFITSFILAVFTNSLNTTKAQAVNFFINADFSPNEGSTCVGTVGVFGYSCRPASVTKNGVTVGFSGTIETLFGAAILREEIGSLYNLRNGGLNVNYADTGYVPTLLFFDYGGGAGSFEANLFLDARKIPVELSKSRSYRVGSILDESRLIFPGIDTIVAEGAFAFGNGEITSERSYLVNNYRKDIDITQPEYGAFSRMSFRDPRAGVAVIGNVNIGLESAESIIDKTIQNYSPIIENGHTIKASFNPESSGGYPIPPSVLAEAMGYSHFNWINIIENNVSVEDMYTGTGKKVVDNGIISTKTGKIFDPLFKGQTICRYDSKSSTDKGCSTIEADTKDFYWDVPGFGGIDLDYYKNALGGFESEDIASVRFSDQPNSVVPIPPNEHTEFTTLLVGVKADDPTYETYDLIDGFGFKWKSNYTCRTQVCKDMTGGISSRKNSFLFNPDIFGLTEEDFTGGIEIIDSSFTFDEFDQDLINFLQEEGALLPGNISNNDSGDDNGNGNSNNPQSIPESNNVFSIFLSAFIAMCAGKNVNRKKLINHK